MNDLNLVTYILYIPFAVVTCLCLIFFAYKSLRAFYIFPEVRSNWIIIMLFSFISLALVLSIIWTFLLITHSDLWITLLDNVHESVLQLVICLMLTRIVHTLRLLRYSRSLQLATMWPCWVIVVCGILMMSVFTCLGMQQWALWMLKMSSLYCATIALIMYVLLTSLWCLRLQRCFCFDEPAVSIFLLSEVFGYSFNALSYFGPVNDQFAHSLTVLLAAAFAEILPAFLIALMITPKDTIKTRGTLVVNSTQ